MEGRRRTEREPVLMTDIADGIVELDSPAGKQLRFTSDRFAHDSYLWIQGKTLTVSFISSRERGNLRELITRARSLGFTIVIPTPLGRMREIVRENGYVRTWEPHKESGGLVELWTLEKPA